MSHSTNQVFLEHYYEVGLEWDYQKKRQLNMQKKNSVNMVPNPRKFQHEYKDSDGSVSIWKYDLDKFSRGPVEVEIVYPKDFLTPDQQLKKANKKLPKSQQQFLNPANGRMVGYYRAKTLGLVN